MYPRPRLTAWEIILLDGEDPPDPNRDVALCEECAEEHHVFWSEQWKEYYSGLL
jgi:hypothetical protein